MIRHFTATAFIVDSRKRTLLLWHKRLRRWMPPGGHVGEDETPEETARRECQEETGLDVVIDGEPCTDLFAENPSEGSMLKRPLALLLENIPASTEPFDPSTDLRTGSTQGKPAEPAHQHMDFLYVARPVDESQPLALAKDEGREMRWFTRDEVAELDDRTEIFANVKRYILNLLPA